MIDTHCHIDLYPDPSAVASAANNAGILTIIVTNLPSAFDRAYPHVRPMKKMRLAVGLHPLLAEKHQSEKRRFAELINLTSYIGEVGLDFSKLGLPTKTLQIESFKFVLDVLQDKPKFITVHSRQAESLVIDLLEEYRMSPVVLHWYSGTLKTLERAVKMGHFFSINPAMINSPNGKRIISALPIDRVLTESDGPFVKMGNRIVHPLDVGVVESYLANLWGLRRQEVEIKIRENFLNLIKPLTKLD